MKPIVLALTALLLAGGPAMALDRRPLPRPSLSQADALRISRGYGMVRISEIEQEDGGWEIEGRDHRGRDLKVSINRSGRVTSVERGDADDDRDDDD